MNLTDAEFEEWRRGMRFSDQARNFFSFLVDSWGFRLVRDLPTLVRFESDLVFVQVFHGRISCEIGLEIGLLQAPEKTMHDLSAVIELTDPDRGQRYKRPAVRERATVGRALEAIADLFRRYGQAAAKGEPLAFTRLQEIGEARIRNFAIESAAARARPRAEKAFRSRDFQSVVDAYSSIESVLSPSEKKKLAYARKKLETGG